MFMYACSMYVFAYLLLIRSVLNNIIHQHGHEFRYAVDACGVCAVWGSAVYCLALGFCRLQPFPGYRVYDVEDAQLVCRRRFLEVREDLLDQG